MYYLTCGTAVMLFSFMFLLLLELTSPLPLVILFFSSVVVSTWYIFLFSSDLFPYMLYLIYIGGLLVLVVYMVIISTNYQLAGVLDKRLVAVLGVGILLMVVLYFSYFPFPPMFQKSLNSVGGLELSMSALILLVLFLLYMFMYVCESVRLGGRALNVSAIAY